MDTQTETLSLGMIRTDGDTQTRKELDEENVARLTEILTEGGDFTERAEVFFDGEEYWLAHGFHRYQATYRAKRSTIEVNVHQGTQEDAQDYACKPNNAGHGQPETRADRRNRAEVMICRHSKWSNNRLARWLGIDRKTVGTYKEQWTTRLGNSQGDTVEGADGKQYPAKRKPKKKPAKKKKASDTSTTEPPVCKNCGGTVFDEDGDCQQCLEPLNPVVVTPKDEFDFATESNEVFRWVRNCREEWPAEYHDALSKILAQLSKEVL